MPDPALGMGQWPRGHLLPPEHRISPCLDLAALEPGSSWE